jgi:hypothetical protein
MCRLRLRKVQHHWSDQLHDLPSRL